jgi:hypothetical protein
MELSNDVVAGVLETAADLYEAEEIEWCQGAWARLDNAGQLSMCAEGALLKAAGVTHDEIKKAQNHGAPEWLHGAEKEQTWYRFSDARAALNARNRRNNVTSWNDADGQTKQEVIDAFKETAKDLRNAQ